MTLLISLLFLLIISGCTDYRCVNGSNNYIEKTLSVSDFENVVNPFSGSVILKKGNPLVNIKIEENIEFALHTVVENKTLKFSQKFSCINSNGIHFEIYSPKYNELTNKGSANWTSDYIECDPKIISNGSGYITLNGISDNQSIILSGSGNVDLSNMPTQNIDIKNNASGKIKTYVRNNANIIINGSGSVEIDSLFGVMNLEINGNGNCIYSGNPKQINFKSNGSGKLIKK